MRRVTLALLAVLMIAGCGSGGPSESTLRREEADAYSQRLAVEEQRMMESGLRAKQAHDLAEARARTFAGARARKLLTSGSKDDQARGRAAAEAAGYDPDELKNEDPADFQ